MKRNLKKVKVRANISRSLVSQGNKSSVTLKIPMLGYRGVGRENKTENK